MNHELGVRRCGFTRLNPVSVVDLIGTGIPAQVDPRNAGLKNAIPLAFSPRGLWLFLNGFHPFGRSVNRAESSSRVHPKWDFLLHRQEIDRAEDGFLIFLAPLCLV